MTGYRHRSGQELVGMGVANLASAAFGGLPATGAIARTATNVRAGGRTPVAGMAHALFLLIIMMAAGPLIAFVPMATLVHHTLCATMSGLSKVYRACGYRVGWASFSGDLEHSREFLNALELLSSLRLCSNVPGQWAVQTALGGYQSVRELVSPGGRLYQSRRAIIEAVSRSRFLELTAPMGALYAFIGVRPDRLPNFDDQQFALDLLEQKHVLVAPGSSFNVPYRNHFRITNLPERRLLDDVFARIEELLDSYGAAERPAAGHTPDLRVVDRAC
jgi:aspartate/methionine/tyrosine aminotransferase